MVALGLVTDRGQPEKAFFSKILNLWAWADKLGQKFWEHLGYFRLIYQHPFWYCVSLVIN